MPALIALAFLLLLPVAVGAGEAFSRADEAVDRAFASGRFTGIAYGVVTAEGLAHARAVGLADAATSEPLTTGHVFRVGSITKVFTTTLLLRLRDEGIVALEDPLERHWDGALPRASALGAPQITLRHLAQHTSGLPRLPANMRGRRTDPYAGFTMEQLRDGLAAVRLESPTGTRVAYSNLGSAVLGQALASACGTAYEEALREHVLRPLGLHHTGFAREDTGGAPWTRGHERRAVRTPVDDWNLGVMAPAGSLASTVGDLARFLAMHFPPETEAEAQARPLRWSTALEATTPTRFEDGEWRRGMAIGWIVRRTPDGIVLWHNGMVRNHASFMAFLPAKRVGVVVLTNTSESVDELGMELLRLAAADGARPVEAPIPDHVKAFADRLLGTLAAEALEPEAIDALFSHDFLEAVPALQVRAVVMGMRSSMGAPASHALAREADGEAWSLTVQGERGVSFRIDFMATATDSPQATYFLARPLP